MNSNENYKESDMKNAIEIKTLKLNQKTQNRGNNNQLKPHKIMKLFNRNMELIISQKGKLSK